MIRLTTPNGCSFKISAVVIYIFVILSLALKPLQKPLSNNLHGVLCKSTNVGTITCLCIAVALRNYRNSE